jgi:putative flippase GtrA
LRFRVRPTTNARSPHPCPFSPREKGTRFRRRAANAADRPFAKAGLRYASGTAIFCAIVKALSTRSLPAQVFRGEKGLIRPGFAQPPPGLGPGGEGGAYLETYVNPAVPAKGRIAEQIPAFAAIGLLGYFVDAGVTYLCAKYLRLSPELARPPGFIVATVVNFLLNRAITFRHAGAPLVRAFARYWLVAMAGLAVNYSVYSACVLLAPIAGISVVPAILPLFVAAGSGAAMFLTFVGFRFFAFSP